MIGFDRRLFLFGGMAALGAGPALAAPGDAPGTFRPEDFGAKGDGVTNDTNAFRALSEAVNLLGGGRIVLGRRTYVVGHQMFGRDGVRDIGPMKSIIDLRDLRRPLVIDGNGATIRCAPGLRYGTFEPATGQPTRRKLPNYDPAGTAAPYVAMVSVRRAAAPVTIRDLELDGNLPRLVIGGPWGDGGYQIACIGLFLEDNRSTETVTNLHAHHQAQDGVEINGDDKRTVRSRFDGLVTEYNGRQGVSLIGGRGYDFLRCKFNKTGRSVIASAPGAGVDIEAEGRKQNRDFTFTDCEFVDNAGCGLVADQGDSERASFVRCLFIGTTAWAAWPGKPFFRFDDCTFVGAISNVCGDPNPARAAQFHRCTFLDDPARARGGTPYLFWKTFGAIADLSDRHNMLFADCVFKLTHNGQLPWSTGAIYRDCRMSQVSRKQAYPRGTYLGRNVINGNVDLYGSLIPGELLLNGTLLRNTHR